MPRTKKPSRRHEKVTGDEDFNKKLDKLVTEQKKNIDSRIIREVRDIELAFKILLGSIRARNIQKTVGELKSELHLPVVSERSSRHAVRSASHDDGYLTETSSHDSGERAMKKPGGIPVATGRRADRRSRSASASARKLAPDSSARVLPQRRSRSVYRTPAYNKHAINPYPTITPKVNPQTPLTVLRQPRLGEMIVSMSGSPVMASASYNNLQGEEMANCNIKLQDGTVLSMQPKLLRQSQTYIPFSLMDSNVMEQLRTLKDNLEKVVRLGEKACK